MAERGRAQARAAAWSAAAVARARRAAVGATPSSLQDVGRRFAERLHSYAAAEAGAGRLMPWLPVAFGFGVVVYFTAEREPALWATTLLAVVSMACAIPLRARPMAFPIALIIAAASAGLAVATAKSSYVAHPVLRYPAYSVEVTGWIEVREERERTDRIVIRVHHIEARRLDTPLQRVRISVRKGTAPTVGTFVSLKARLSPPLAPLRPGGYDFARDLYFQGIGASGSAFGAIKRLEPPEPPSLWLRYATAIASMRDAIDARIRMVLTGDTRAIASALLTGKRDAISTPVNDAMFISGLGHVLSISGYHMAVVAGVVFFALRGLLALVPVLATGYPIKKWAAFAALIAATFYLLLSGSEVATQRSYLMTAVVLIGVMVDRQTMTFRTLAVSAFVVLSLAPEAVVHPSFQMSFAATLALVASYRHGLPWMIAGADTSFGARIALWGGREVVALILASLVAGFATTIYAAYHFHRLAPYGTVANLLAMPVVSALVMPAGLLGIAAIPFGFDAPLWRLMGLGVEWMVAVALWVASLPGAVGRIHAFGTGPLLLATAGLILICLLRSPLRWSGAALAGIAIWTAARTTPPDLFVAPNAEVIAARTTDGRLGILKLGNDTFAAREWLAADADARAATDPQLASAFRCDEAGCIAKLKGGALVSAVLAPAAFEEDCRRALLIVTRRQAPPGCAATVIDRNVWRTSGALALYRTAEGFAVTPSRPPGYDRPWSPRQAVASAPATVATPTNSRVTAPDATPREEDLRPED
jgi:competence protein ComEC